MDVELRPDFPVTDEACREATGKGFGEWSSVLSAMPEIDGKRREAINWLWDQVGRSSTQAWWGTTIYVEHERRLGRVQKDGRPEGYNICVTKSVTAPAEGVLDAIVRELPADVRVRPAKDAKGSWQTPGAPVPVGVEATVKDAAGKVAVNVMFKRISTRGEADGLRRAWGAKLDEIKRAVEEGR